MKIYITKYATTQGIIERDDARETVIPDMVAVREKGSSLNLDTCYHKGEYTTDIIEARKIALAKIEKRRKSLWKQLWALDELQRKIEQESGYSSTADGHGIS